MLISKNLKRLLESPSKPFYSMDGVPDAIRKLDLSSADAITWVIRKPGIYLFGPTKDSVYHGTINDFINNTILNQVEDKVEIQKYASEEDIVIVGDYNSYKDFIIKKSDDYRRMGYLTGRLWSQSKVIASYDDDKLFLERMPEVVKMLKTGLQVDKPEEYIIEFQSYRTDGVKFENVKRIGDIVKGEVKARELTDKEKHLRHLQVALHTETDPIKRKRLKRLLGLLPPLRYKLDIPPMLRNQLNQNPQSVHKIRWGKWGLNKADIMKYMRLGLLAEDDTIDESPDTLDSNKFPEVEKFKTLKREDAYTFTALSEDVILFTKTIKNGNFNGTHWEIAKFVSVIAEAGREKATKEFIDIQKEHWGIEVLGNLTFDILLNAHTNSGSERNIGIVTGRLWTDIKVISIWQSDDKYTKHFKMFTNLLKGLGFSASDILQFRVDMDKIGEDEVVTFRDILNKQLDSKLSKEKATAMKQAHIEVDPNKRKAIKQKLGMINPQDTAKKLPKWIIASLRRNPETFERMDFSKWGVTGDEAKQLVMALHEGATIDESPDKPYLPGTKIDYNDEDAYTFSILTNKIALVGKSENQLTEKNIFHHHLKLFNEEIVTRKYNKEQIQKLSKSKKIKILGNYDSYKDFFQDYTISYRSLGILTGRVWITKKVISFWQSDQDVFDFLRLIVKFLNDLKIPKHHIMSYKFDLYQNNISDGDIPTLQQLLKTQNIEYTPETTDQKNDRLAAMKKVHYEKDPVKRKNLKKIIDPEFDSKQTYKYNLSPTIRSWIKNHPNDLHKVNWKKFGFTLNGIKKLATQLNEDADTIVVNNQKLSFNHPDSVAFGLINSVMFYQEGSNSNHQKIYFELKNRLAPNYPKLAKALNMNRLDVVNKFLIQIQQYLSNKSINVIGDLSHLPSILSDIYNNDIENADVLSIVKQAELGQALKLDKNIRRIRTEVFDISGRAWRNVKVVSFWNSVQQAKLCLQAFDLLVNDIKEYRFEFIDDVNHLYTYDEVLSGSVRSGQQGDAGEDHITTNPDVKQLRKKQRLDKMSSQEYSDYIDSKHKKMGSLTSWERERTKDLAEGMMDKYFDVKDGIGAVPFNQNIDYMGFIVKMTPQEFRRIVPPGVSGPDSKGYVKQALKNGQKLGPPFLEVRWDESHKVWQTVGHEGRSRMDAIGEVFGNDVLVPVHMFPGNGMRARHITDDMKRAVILPQR